jgi:crossover junction endodeoxyribonuclease RuvC
MSPTPATRILGIDPGLRLTGFGVIDLGPGGRLGYVASGVIRIPDGELPKRLATIYTQLAEVIDRYRPNAAAVERVFVNVNPQSTLLLGQARGAAICAAATAGLPVSEYSALQVKQAVVGYGRATKEQVQAMVVQLLALPGSPSRDAADALACATCHAHGGATAVALLAADGIARGIRARLGREAGPAPALPPALARRGLRMRRGRLVAS